MIFLCWPNVCVYLCIFLYIYSFCRDLVGTFAIECKTFDTFCAKCMLFLSECMCAYGLSVCACMLRVHSMHICQPYIYINTHCIVRNCCCHSHQTFWASTFVRGPPCLFQGGHNGKVFGGIE